MHTCIAKRVCAVSVAGCAWQAGACARLSPAAAAGSTKSSQGFSIHSFLCLLCGMEDGGSSTVHSASRRLRLEGCGVGQRAQREFRGSGGRQAFEAAVASERPHLRYGWSSPELAEDDFNRSHARRLPRPSNRCLRSPLPASALCLGPTGICPPMWLAAQ